MTLNSELNLNKQHGKGVIVTLLILFILVFFASIIVKLAPVYLENMAIQQSMQNMAKTGGDGLSGAANVRESMAKRFLINNIKTASIDDVSVIKQPLWFEVSVNYQVEVPYIYNLSFLIKFDERIEVPNR